MYTFYWFGSVGNKEAKVFVLHVKHRIRYAKGATAFVVVRPVSCLVDVTCVLQCGWQLYSVSHAKLRLRSCAKNCNHDRRCKTGILFYVKVF